MIAVFLGFATEGDVVVKQIGIGLAVAILVDATLVRMVLVPATMALLGRRNWWLPRRLDALLPHLDAEVHDVFLPTQRPAPERLPAGAR
jgi:RND superfamily putative drug exporter